MTPLYEVTLRCIGEEECSTSRQGDHLYVALCRAMIDSSTNAFNREADVVEELAFALIHVRGFFDRRKESAPPDEKKLLWAAEEYLNGKGLIREHNTIQ